MTQPNGYPEKWGVCIMCGAEQGQACTVISGSGEPGDRPGDARDYPHGNRTQPHQIGTEYDPARDGRGFVAIKDEPAQYGAAQ